MHSMSGRFCSEVPGMLISHSVLVSCEARSFARRSFSSTLAPASADAGPSSSYPIARIEIAWRPAARLPLGKAKRPSRPVTTVCVIVEPAPRALTSTPSIGPSSGDATRPLSVWAAARSQAAKASAASAQPENFTGGSAALEPALGLDGLHGLGLRGRPPEHPRLLVAVLGAGDGDVGGVDLLAEARELVQARGGGAGDERDAALHVRGDLRIGN